jgi:hypothetical protein
MRRLLAVAAGGEAVTGLALAIDPPLVGRLLLGAEPFGAGLPMSRVAGIALLALGLACWPARDAITRRPPALRAMSTYSVLAMLYLLSLGVRGEWVGRLLWPAVVLHAALTVWCFVVLLQPGERVHA